MFRTTLTLTTVFIALSTLAAAGDHKFKIMPKMIVQQPMTDVQPMLIDDGHDDGFQDNQDFYVPPARSLGFYGHFDAGQGMHVERVLCGSFAAQLGLEPGDTIVRVNGMRLQCEHDYFDALRTYSDVRLLVRDVNTGRLVWTRTICLDSHVSSPVPYQSHLD